MGTTAIADSYTGKFYPEMKQLIANLKEYGFEVWIPHRLSGDPLPEVRCRGVRHFKYKCRGRQVRHQGWRDNG
ncbi:MAG: hypothetical protein MZV63_38670 [Marinilabiliales bacterium]|nr:hypothetical protein [Marinilabiliales bacterium]